VGGGLALLILLKVALFFLSLRFIYINSYVPTKATIRNASKEGKPDKKPYHPYGFRNPYKTMN
jgi:hypothetical protein